MATPPKAFIPSPTPSPIHLPDQFDVFRGVVFHAVRGLPVFPVAFLLLGQRQLPGGPVARSLTTRGPSPPFPLSMPPLSIIPQMAAKVMHEDV